MKPFHDGPLTFEKCPGFPSADGANYGEVASEPWHESSFRNRPMRRRVPDKLRGFAGRATPVGTQTRTVGRGFPRWWVCSWTPGGAETPSPPPKLSHPLLS